MSVAFVQWDSVAAKVDSVPLPSEMFRANNAMDGDRATIGPHAALGTVNGIVFKTPRLPAGAITALRVRSLMRHAAASLPMRRNAHGVWWRESDVDPWEVLEVEQEGLPTSGSPEEAFHTITPAVPANVQVLVGNWEQGDGDPFPTDP